MIASLNIIVKTFVKTCVGLLTMIVVIRRRLVIILHLGEKYAKMKSM